MKKPDHLQFGIDCALVGNKLDRLGAGTAAIGSAYQPQSSGSASIGRRVQGPVFRMPRPIPPRHLKRSIYCRIPRTCMQQCIYVPNRRQQQPPFTVRIALQSGNFRTDTRASSAMHQVVDQALVAHLRHSQAGDAGA